MMPVCNAIRLSLVLECFIETSTNLNTPFRRPGATASGLRARHCRNPIPSGCCLPFGSLMVRITLLLSVLICDIELERPFVT